MLRGGSVLLALARSAWHYSQALAVAWRVYRAPGAVTWQGLHRVHHFALEHKLDTKSVEDPLAGTTVEIREKRKAASVISISLGASGRSASAGTISSIVWISFNGWLCCMGWLRSISAGSSSARESVLA